MLSLINGFDGCSYHRQLAPNGYMEHKYGMEIINTTTPRILTPEQRKGVANLSLRDYANHVPILKSWGMAIWFDLDDLWELETQHPFHAVYKQMNVAGLTKKLIQEADVVTAPNERLVEICRKLNPNTIYVPNFINPLEPQFENKKAQYGEQVNFGWVGGNIHVQDVELLKISLEKLYSDRRLDNKYRVFYGGYMKDETLCENIASILRGNNHANSPKHFGFMQNLPVDRYATMYNNVDVALAPLKATRYNECKSALKIVEAGHFGIPVIASDVYPYNEVIEHGRDGFLVNDKRGHKDWLKYMKHFINNPEEVTKMGAALKEKVDRLYNADKWTEERKRIHDSL